MSTYVPPHMRNRKQQQPNVKENVTSRTIIETKEESFPALGTSVSPRSWGSPTKKFSSLAMEWKERDDEKALSEEIDRERAKRSTTQNVLPMFRPSRKFIEDPQPDEATDSVVNGGDGWTDVVRTKIRKPKTERQVDDNDEESDEKDGTCWDDEENEESCWDERH